MSFLELCENIEDSPTDNNKHYDLLDIIFLTLSAVLSGAKGLKALHIFGVAQFEWLREYREFTNGIPTRHSIGRIIETSKPKVYLRVLSNGTTGSGCKEKESRLPLMVKWSGAQEMVRPSTRLSICARVIDWCFCACVFSCPVGNACLALFRIAGVIVTRCRLLGGGHPVGATPWGPPRTNTP
jgi:hypothetical protein